MRSILQNRPIGIFDSGIGGLTVASAIAKKLPKEQILYFGDTAHLPYGEKSASAIREYASQITKFFLEKNCKAIIIACNTASAVATRSVKKIAGKAIPVINVIDPTVDYVSNLVDSGKVGVIATKATVNSRVYAKRIEQKNDRLKVSMLATPLLVSMIEEGYFNNNISQAIINSYLEKSTLRDIRALILGCTHFPLIKKEVERYYNNRVKVVDSSEVIATYTLGVLEKWGLASTSKPGAHHFFVSDTTPSFSESTKIFFGKKVRLEKKNLWS